MDIKLKAGKKYSICSCGLSGSLPFCDNTHREFNAANNMEYKSVKITPEKDTIIKVASSRWESVQDSK
jgi:CDGSH-type Zn-finger protein